MSIVVVGSAGRDLIVKVSSLPKEGETVIAPEYDECCGGKGANQVVAAKRLGADVTFIANIGNDAFGDKLIEFYKSERLDIGGINRDPNNKTALAFISVDTKGQNSIAVAMGANNKLDKKIIDKNLDIIHSAKIVMTQLEIPLETVNYLSKIISKDSLFILNPAPAQKLNDDLLQRVDILTPNETEATILSGIEVVDINTAKDAANVLHKKGVKIVIITLGEKGALLSKADGKQTLFAANKVKVVDTTAAGDTFNGVLSYCLDKDKSIEEAIKIANIASGISVTVEGAEKAAPTLEKLRKYIDL